MSDFDTGITQEVAEEQKKEAQEKEIEKQEKYLEKEDSIKSATFSDLSYEEIQESPKLEESSSNESSYSSSVSKSQSSELMKQKEPNTCEEVKETESKSKQYIQSKKVQQEQAQEPSLVLNKSLDEVKEPFQSKVEDPSPKKVLQRAETLKEEGNTLYKEKRYKEAIQKYSHSIELLAGGLAGPQFDHIKALSSKILYNIGMCHRKQQELKTAVTYFTESIRVDPDYLKPYYQRGEIYFINQDYLLAYEDTKKFFEQNRSHEEAYERMKKCQEKIKEIKQAQKALSVNMFSRSNKKKEKEEEKYLVNQQKSSPLWKYAMIGAAALLVGGAVYYQSHRSEQ